jgi:cytochrome c peroxidase
MTPLQALKSSVLAALALAAAAAVAAQPASERGAASPGLPGLPGLLPPVPVPADNPMSAAKIELGRILFWDTRLSGNGATACVSCHQPALGLGERSALSRGYPGTIQWRNTRTVWNAAHYQRLLWDGGAASLEAQAPGAATAPVEGNGNRTMMEMRLRLVPEYVQRFRAVFGTEWPRLDDAWRAIAAFERTLVSDPARVPFDRWQAGQADAISAAAQRGWVLFNGRAGCASCHSGPLLSDQGFHALGVPGLPENGSSMLLQITTRWHNVQRAAPGSVPEVSYEDHGREYVSRDPADRGRFLTPTLRELRHTGPYMHNGALGSLRAVVDFFDRGGGHTPNKSPLLRPLGLSEQDKTDLVALLESMSMERLPEMKPPRVPPSVPLPVDPARDH